MARAVKRVATLAACVNRRARSTRQRPAEAPQRPRSASTAWAALCPPMPRDRAAAPGAGAAQQHRRRPRSGTPHCWAGVSRRARFGAHGQSRSPWKMWPPGMARSASMSCGIFASMHGLPSRVGGRQTRSARRGARRARRSPARPRRRAWRLRVGRRRAEAGVCSAEVGQRVRAGWRESPRIDGSVRRVAVDLARHRRSGTRPAAASAYAASSWL